MCREVWVDTTLGYVEQQFQTSATIPLKKNRLVPRDWNYAAYRERHLVVCYIDKHASRFLAHTHFASIFIWLDYSPSV